MASVQPLGRLGGALGGLEGPRLAPELSFCPLKDPCSTAEGHVLCEERLLPLLW